MWDFQEEVGNWGESIFGKSSQNSVVAHLKREVKELAESHEPDEAADCFLLLLHHAHKGGYDLFKEAQKKFGIIQQREWGKPDKDGVTEHLKE